MAITPFYQEETYYQDTSSFVPQSSEQTGFVNGLTGILSKAADVYLDVTAAKAKIASTYPTGQTAPGVVNAQQTAAQQTASFNYAPYLIGGGVLLLAVILLRKS